MSQTTLIFIEPWKKGFCSQEDGFGWEVVLSEAGGEYF